MSDPCFIRFLLSVRFFVLAVLVVSIGSGTSDLRAQTQQTECPLHDDKKAGRQSTTTSPYAGFESRLIKALSTEQHQQLLAGHGMGLALVAELNHYPGPKHVMELASELELTEAQIRETRTIFHEMQTRARALGHEIVDAEAALDARFGAADIDEATLVESIAKLGRLQADLRIAHLRAHLQMKASLSADQVSRYDELRGYVSSKNAAD